MFATCVRTRSRSFATARSIAKLKPPLCSAESKLPIGVKIPFSTKCGEWVIYAEPVTFVSPSSWTLLLLWCFLLNTTTCTAALQQLYYKMVVSLFSRVGVFWGRGRLRHVQTLIVKIAVNDIHSPCPCWMCHSSKVDWFAPCKTIIVTVCQHDLQVVSAEWY